MKRRKQNADREGLDFSFVFFFHQPSTAKMMASFRTSEVGGSEEVPRAKDVRLLNRGVLVLLICSTPAPVCRQWQQRLLRRTLYRRPS